MVEKRGLPILLIGILSVTFAEVFSGSAPLWFLDPWGFLVVLPLYWSHILLLLNLAIRTSRATVSHLYLWGIFFGLYETWVTKVVWAGFFDSPPLLGTIFGFAIFEAVLIVFFWHTVFSFIIPIIVYQYLAVSANPNAKILTGHQKFFMRSRRNNMFWGLILLVGSGGVAAGTGLNVAATAISVLGSVGWITIIYKLIIRNESTFSIDSLKLSKRGFILVTLFVIFLYIVTFPLLLPERIPTPWSILITLGIYVFMALLVFTTPEARPVTTVLKAENSIFTWRTLKRFFVIFLALAMFWTFLPMVDLLLGVGIIFGGALLAIPLTIWNFYRTMKSNE